MSRQLIQRPHSNGTAAATAVNGTMMITASSNCSARALTQLRGAVVMVGDAARPTAGGTTVESSETVTAW
jgi:hypothetical protein